MRRSTLLLLTCACGSVTDLPDARRGPEDAGASVDAAPDASAPDAARPDAQPSDAAPPDAGVNRAPRVIGFEASPNRGPAPLAVSFSWTVEDPDGDALTCTLDPDGDGALAALTVGCSETSSAAWTYPAPTEAQAVFRAEDPAGASHVATAPVVAERIFELPTYLRGGFELAGAPVPALGRLPCEVTVTATTGDDITARARAAIVQAAGLAPPGGHCVVRLPAGTFEVTGTLSLRTGVVLRGAGAERTRLAGRMPGASAVIAARGGAAAHTYEGEQVRGLKGQSELTVTSTLAAQAQALLLAGGPVYGELSIDNDPAKFPAEWAREYAAFGIGQVFEVLAVAGEVLMLDRPLNEPYLTAGLARRLELRGPGQMVERVGVADLSLVRADANHAGTVAFDRTAQAFLLRVRLEDTGWAHLHVDRSLSCTVRRSHFEGAHAFGGGGEGYGVNLRHHTTGCLVEDNSFRDLRHAMILQLGSNGNVLGYNYAEDSHDDIGWLKADISLHGHYTHMNLIEGNVVEKIHVSDWWGPAPFHTVFRNRASRGGVYVDDRSEDCAVIDNVSDANFPLEAPLRIDGSVREVLCVHNASPDGAPLSSSHALCDDENDPAQVHERPRPESFYREGPLVTSNGRLPAQVRLEAGHPVPPPP